MATILRVHSANLVPVVVKSALLRRTVIPASQASEERTQLTAKRASRIVSFLVCHALT